MDSHICWRESGKHRYGSLLCEGAARVEVGDLRPGLRSSAVSSAPISTFLPPIERPEGVLFERAIERLIWFSGSRGIARSFRQSSADKVWSYYQVSQQPSGFPEVPVGPCGGPMALEVLSVGP